MPGPAVYVASAVGVVAVLIALKEFVYEPHVAPKIEAWAEAFVESRRRQRNQRHGPIPAQSYPVHEDGDENAARRSRSSQDDPTGGSFELDPIETINERRDGARHSGLRHRRAAGMMDESNTFLPYTPISPTHVIFDSSAPPSPISPSEGRSQQESPVHTAGPSTVSTPLHAMKPVSQSCSSPVALPMVSSPRLSASMLIPSIGSVMTPNLDHAVSTRSFPSSRSSTPDGPAMDNTAVVTPTDRTLISHHEVLGMPSFPVSRSESPFSDVYSAVARSTTLNSSRSNTPSPILRSPSESELGLNSDSDDDVLSLRSGMFSPSIGAYDERALHVQSPFGSEASSWASVGRRTPEF
ncbi:hypothetical protein AcV5_001479 [Taiwanofungus camphoratus]|nr:hypothetical protein AcV5_001479 [Antrodia cinnamomea]